MYSQLELNMALIVFKSGGGFYYDASCHNDGPGSCSVEEKETVELHSKVKSSSLFRSNLASKVEV